MAVRRYQFGKQMDKKGKTMGSNMKRASTVSSVSRKPDKYDMPSIGDKIILGLLRAKKRITGGGKKKKSLTTTRTKQITSQLKQAGLSQKQIDKMRGKKK